ncbi:hypothetical protein [Methylobacterium brachiatum]|uniref:hypothetical protein n=1 Tax=Methylobacterium brachiatum TaxID=269660 RepID=UPI00197BA0B6|nr:hypothetical protein [Methylobacterium brachiatum]
MSNPTTDLAARFEAKREAENSAWSFGRLGSYLARVAASRPPDVIIGGEADPYMRRWWVIPRNRWFNVYLHHFMRSDDDRALHDHPWWNVSFLLQGQYAEHTISAGGINVFTTRKAGEVKARWATHAHRIELTHGPCWTLFITGPRLRTWGFHCPRGWVPWKEFTNPADGGQTVGRGCGEQS